MAKINIIIPEPRSEYDEENQRQISQALRTTQDQLNTNFQQDLREEAESEGFFLG